MDKTLSEAVRGPGYHRSAVALMLLACLLIAGCAQRDSGDTQDQRGGFYGGVSSGMTRQ